MNSKERYAFDTNTIISAFLFNQSNPGLALLQALGSRDRFNVISLTFIGRGVNAGEPFS